MAFESPRPDISQMMHEARTTPGVHLLKYESGCVSGIARALSGGFLGIQTTAIVVTRVVTHQEAVNSLREDGLKIDMGLVNNNEPAYNSYALYSFWPTIGRKKT